MKWKLMTDEAISRDQREVLSDFVLNEDKLTQGPVVKEFEKAWYAVRALAQK